MTSLDDCLKPYFMRPSLRLLSGSPLNMVPSMISPFIEAIFPPIISRICPTVILEGMACGLIMRSGIMPSSVNGMSSCGTTAPMTPFCPCLDANLSPSSGILSLLTLIFTTLLLLSETVRMTLSTKPFSLGLMVMDDSLRLCGPSLSPPSSRNLGGDVLPTSTSEPST